MRDQGLTRRRFLVATLSLGAGVTLYVVADKFPFTERKGAIIRSSQIFVDPPVVIDVGREYLRLFPEEKDVKLLNKILLSSTSGKPNTSGDLRGFLWEKVRQDFEKGDVISIYQWMLSRTEGQLCALAALGS